MKKLIVSSGLFFLFLLLAPLFLHGCGGGGGDSSRASTPMTISGTISVPENQPDARVAKDNESSPLPLFYTTIQLNGSHVTLCKPTSNGITKIAGAPTATTNRTGSYSVEVTSQTISVESGQPLFVCASNANGTFTLLSLLPSDLMSDGAVVSLDVSPSSTAASLLLCAGGKYPPSTGNPCYAVRQDSFNNVMNSVVAQMNENPQLYGDLGDLNQWLNSLLDTSAVSSTIAQVAGEYGTEPTPSGQTYCGASFLPIVFSPTSGGSAPAVPNPDDFDTCYGGSDSASSGSDTTDTTDTTTGDAGTDGTTTDGTTPPYSCAGSVTGGWTGSCCIADLGCENGVGSFNLTISSNGSVSGSYAGDDSGSIAGNVSSSCAFSSSSSGGGSTSLGSWSGNFSGAGSSVSGSGTWSSSENTVWGVESCSGTWSG